MYCLGLEGPLAYLFQFDYAQTNSYVLRDLLLATAALWSSKSAERLSPMGITYPSL